MNSMAMVKEEPDPEGSERSFPVIVKDEPADDESVLDNAKDTANTERQEDDEFVPDSLEDSAGTDNRDESASVFDTSTTQSNELAKETGEAAVAYGKNFQCEGRFHPKTGEPCERSFTRQYNLDRHIRKQHMEVTKDGFVQYSPNGQGVLHKEVGRGSKVGDEANASPLRDYIQEGENTEAPCVSLIRQRRYEQLCMEAKTMTPEERSQEYADLMLQIQALNSVILAAPSQSFEQDHPLPSLEAEPSARKRRRQSGQPSPNKSPILSP